MEIEGKIIYNLGETSGTSKAGRAWKKREYVLETQDSYPKKVHFDFFGERADQYPLEVGDVIRLSFDIDSREYNGRWFTSISAWKAEKIDGTSAPGATQQPANQGFNKPAPPAAPDFGSDETDDLPF
ncbi:MAG: DUF3127 domain-containing protein [Muribaculaceae bacterium]|nr:DUF3127 domain-containing protein [Muribaculaceae bacterium]